MTDFDVEYVPCCVCRETGEMPRLLFFKRICSVCRGRGERPIMIATNLSAYDKAAVLHGATVGSINFVRMPSPLESMIGQTFGAIF